MKILFTNEKIEGIKFVYKCTRRKSLNIDINMLYLFICTNSTQGLDTKFNTNWSLQVISEYYIYPLSKVSILDQIFLQEKINDEEGSHCNLVDNGGNCEAVMDVEMHILHSQL